MTINEFTDGSPHLTPQEHIYTGGSSDSSYYARFYTPKSVQKGEDILTVNARRKKEKTFTSSFHLWIYQDGSQVMENVECNLSPLDLATGETLSDPRPLDERLRLNPKYREKLRLRG